MSLDKFIENNYLSLSENYNDRNLDDTFEHFCEFVYVGISNKYCWLPYEYTKGIIIKYK